MTNPVATAVLPFKNAAIERAVEVAYAVIEDVHYCPAEYSDYIMENHDPSERLICNGDTLLEAEEDGYLLEEFLLSKGYIQ